MPTHPAKEMMRYIYSGGGDWASVMINVGDEEPEI